MTKIMYISYQIEGGDWRLVDEETRQYMNTKYGADKFEYVQVVEGDNAHEIVRELDKKHGNIKR